MANIRIIALSAQVKLPDWLKQEFIGLIFPVSEVPDSHMPLYLSGDVTDVMIQPVMAEYFVKGAVVLQILNFKSPRAAKWLEANTALSSGNSWVGFNDKECILS